MVELRAILLILIACSSVIFGTLGFISLFVEAFINNKVSPEKVTVNNNSQKLQ